MKHVLSFLWLTGMFLAAAFVATAEAKSRFEIKQLVISEAQKSDVPVSLALAVAKVESDFNEKALSSAGARGVMQIMPATAQLEFGVHPDELWTAEENIRLGIRFLEKLHRQYDHRWELALSHYNGGTLKNKRAHSFNQGYVRKVQKWQQVYFEQASLWDAIDTVSVETDTAAPTFSEWRVRDLSMEKEDDYPRAPLEEITYWEDDDEENWSRPQIIVVEREPHVKRWHRPPPRPGRPFGRRGGHPRHLR